MALQRFESNWSRGAWSRPRTKEGAAGRDLSKYQWGPLDSGRSSSREVVLSTKGWGMGEASEGGTTRIWQTTEHNLFTFAWGTTQFNEDDKFTESSIEREKRGVEKGVLVNAVSQALDFSGGRADALAYWWATACGRVWIEGKVLPWRSTCESRSESRVCVEAETNTLTGFWIYPEILG